MQNQSVYEKLIIIFLVYTWMQIMKNSIQKWTLFLVLQQTLNITALSMVYNFRIAQITNQPMTKETRNKSNTLVAIAFDQYRKQYNGTTKNFLGGFGSYISIFKPYYFRVDGAFAYIKERQNHTTTFSGTETDDILFTLGRHFIVNKKMETTVSGFFGFPTHKNFNLQHAALGIGQLGTGFQLDCGYTIDSMNNLVGGTRFFYFIPNNHVYDIAQKKHTFSIGNLADFLCAYRHTTQHHGLEFGYTARFGFGATLDPDPNDFAQKGNFINSNFYGVYKYNFLINRTLNRFLLCTSYGFDHIPKVYGNKYIITVWGSWSISF